jgi:hypothetical protein
MYKFLDKLKNLEEHVHHVNLIKDQSLLSFGTNDEKIVRKK